MKKTKIKIAKIVITLKTIIMTKKVILMIIITIIKKEKK